MNKMIPLALGYLLDIGIFAYYVRVFGRPRGRLCAPLAAGLALYTVYRLFYGYAYDTSSIRPVLVFLVEILLLSLALWNLYSRPARMALAEGMTLCIALNVGRKLFFHLEIAFLPAWISALPCLCQLLVAANKLLLTFILRPERPVGERQIIHEQELFLLLFSLLNCVMLSLANVTSSDDIRLLNLDMIGYLSAFICAVAVKRFARINARVEEMNEIQADMRLQYELYTRQTENNETIRRMYHDLKHQLKAIEASGGSAASLAVSMNGELEKLRGVTYTANPILNAILGEAERKAREADIRFAVESALGDFAFMENRDLVSLFSNALSNAVEAASQCEEGRREISVRYTETPAYALTVIENTFAGERKTEDGRLLTTKKGREGYHGIGVKSIRYAVERYGGSCRFLWNDGRFTLNIMIPKT